MSATFLSISLLRRYLNSGLSSYRADFNLLSEGAVRGMGGSLAEPSSDPVFDPSLLGACDTYYRTITFTTFSNWKSFMLPSHLQPSLIIDTFSSTNVSCKEAILSACDHSNVCLHVEILIQRSCVKITLSVHRSFDLEFSPQSILVVHFKSSLNNNSSYHLLAWWSHHLLL